MGSNCLHCGIRKARRARGLCWRCSITREIRCLYGIKDSRYNRRGAGSSEAHGVPEPTQAMPGTEAKIEVLRCRAEAGLLLWHYLDGCCRD